jgi:8-oxo-dGTP diphosphatase
VNGFAVTVDLVVLTVRDGTLEVLLPQGQENPALPGMSLGTGLTLDGAAAHAFESVTGLGAAAHLEQLATYGDPDRQAISVAYLALLPVGADHTARGAELYPVPSLLGPGPQLTLDDDRILADAVDRMRSKLEYTTIGATLLPEEFTLGDLRRVYESVWGVSLHHSNFARKVRSVDGFVEPTGRRAATSGAPELFRKGPASLMMPALMRP